MNKQTIDKRPAKQFANRQYYRSMIDYKPEACALVDFEGDILMVNTEWINLSLFSEQETIFYPLRRFLLNLSDTKNPLDEKVLSEFSGVYFFLKADWSLFSAEIEFSEIEGQKYLCILRPKQAVEQQPESNQPTIEKTINQKIENSTIEKPTEDISINSTTDSNLLNSIEHEVRTSLNGILGVSSELAQLSNQLSKEQLKNYLSLLVRKTNQLKLIFDKRMNGVLAQQINPNLSGINLESFIRSLIYSLQPLVEENNISLSLECSPDYHLTTDAIRLRFILHYFLMRAIRYSRKQEILVEVKENKELGKLIIRIDNIGMDLPNELIRFINQQNPLPEYDTYQPVLTNYPDLKQVLQELNTIHAKSIFESQEQWGEIVGIAFPLNAIQSSNSSNDLLEESLRAKKMNVLVVEDDKVNSAVAVFFLESFCNPKSALSGNEALNIIDKYHNQQQVFDLILMDIDLPQPWDGISLKSEIISRFPEYRQKNFFALTAGTDDAWISRILSAGFDTCLIKPFERTQLMQRIDKFIH